MSRVATERGRMDTSWYLAYKEVSGVSEVDIDLDRLADDAVVVDHPDVDIVL